jgi:hypothetical protein
VNLIPAQHRCKHRLDWSRNSRDLIGRDAQIEQFDLITKSS